MVRNVVQELGSQPPISRCLLERELADEVRGAIRARTDCRAPFFDIFAVEGDSVEDMASGSMEPRRRDQRTDFEHGAVIGETVDDILDELLRQLHVLTVAKHSESVGEGRH